VTGSGAEERKRLMVGIGWKTRLIVDRYDKFATDHGSLGESGRNPPTGRAEDSSSRPLRFVGVTAEYNTHYC